MYHQHYGLRDNPFAVTPDARFLFPSEAHREALAAISYGIEDRKGFVLILGEVGTGKTTVVRRILNGLGEHTRAIYLFNVRVNFEELLGLVLRELHVPCAAGGRLAMVEALNEFLLGEAMAGRTVVLVIDEAQHLAPEVLEELRMLTNLETARDKLLQIILVGQPELGRTLALPSLRQLRQRIAVIAELRPLTRPETRAYVAHRLAIAGAHGRSPFTARAMRRLHRVSHGIPRIINVVADKALVLGYGAHARRVGAGLVHEAARDHTRLERAGRPRVRWAPALAVAAVAAVVGVAAFVATFPPARALLAASPSIPIVRAMLAAPDVAPPPVATPADVVAPAAASLVVAQAEAAPVVALPERTAPAPPPAPATAIVQPGDTLAVLVRTAYGRVDLTLLDIIKSANPLVTDIDVITPGIVVRFPHLGPDAVVARASDGTYAVAMLTAPTAVSPEVERVRVRATGAKRTVELVPVRLSGAVRGVRVVVGGFSDAEDAEAFYRAAADASRPGRSRS